MRNLARVEVLLPNESSLKIDDLLVFDAHCLDAETRRQLLRLFPKLVQVSRAWRAHHSKNGCIGCRKQDPTITIAARLRRRGMPWRDIYEVVGLDRSRSIIPLSEQERFENSVRWRMKHFDVPEKKPSPRYAVGGFCDNCYMRLRKELLKTVRAFHAGRDAAEETAALTRKFDMAQWLLNGDAKAN